MPSHKPRWAPNENQRKLIQGFGAIGLNYKQMAILLEVHEKTLMLAFKKDETLRHLLESGKANASANVRNTAFKMATSGRNPSMTIFWLKTREGFCETIQLAGHDGGPIKSEVKHLNEEQLRSEIEKVRAANKICDED